MSARGQVVLGLLVAVVMGWLFDSRGQGNDNPCYPVPEATPWSWRSTPTVKMEAPAQGCMVTPGNVSVGFKVKTTPGQQTRKSADCQPKDEYRTLNPAKTCTWTASGSASPSPAGGSGDTASFVIGQSGSVVVNCNCTITADGSSWSDSKSVTFNAHKTGSGCVTISVTSEDTELKNALKDLVTKIPFVTDADVNGGLTGSACPACCNEQLDYTGEKSFGGGINVSVTAEKVLSPWDYKFKVAPDWFWCEISGTLQVGPYVGVTAAGSAGITTTVKCNDEACVQGGGQVALDLSLGAKGTAKVSVCSKEIGVDGKLVGTTGVSGSFGYNSCEGWTGKACWNGVYAKLSVEVSYLIDKASIEYSFYPPAEWGLSGGCIP